MPVPLWSDDFSGLSLEAVLAVAAENRAWNKRLREGMAALVTTRLAKTITREEYAASRQRANEDAVECKRREEILVRDIDNRQKAIAYDQVLPTTLLVAVILNVLWR